MSYGRGVATGGPVCQGMRGTKMENIIMLSAVGRAHIGNLRHSAFVGEGRISVFGPQAPEGFTTPLVMVIIKNLERNRMEL